MYCKHVTLEGRFEKDGNGRTRNNGQKLLLRNFKTSQAMNFFPVKIAATWNQLPENIVSAGTVNTFKNRLDKFWITNPQYYILLTLRPELLNANEAREELKYALPQRKPEGRPSNNLNKTLCKMTTATSGSVADTNTVPGPAAPYQHRTRACSTIPAPYQGLQHHTSTGSLP
ncbi:hypothetical protein FHG87_013207 [Trinorchestia longiramus]|nr:hypothetical protein FHG87_013207 [Trinorchestia longiramus]